MVEALTMHTRSSAGGAVKPQTHKLTAFNAVVLVEEIRLFKQYCSQVKLRKVSDWFVLARTVATAGSKAKSVIENLIVQEFGGEDRYQFSLEDPRVDWHAWWYTLELRLRIKAGYDASAEASIAIDKYNAVSLKQGRDWKAVEQFLHEYEDARTEMIRVGQLRVSDYLSVQLDILDIQKKMWGTALLGWLQRQDLRGIYLVVDDQSEDGHCFSLFGRIRQYVDAEKAEKGCCEYGKAG